MAIYKIGPVVISSRATQTLVAIVMAVGLTASVGTFASDRQSQTPAVDESSQTETVESPAPTLEPTPDSNPAPTPV